MIYLSIFAFIALIIDQISKYVSIDYLGLSPLYPIDIFPNMLHLRYGENRGINFGLFQDNADPWMLIAMAIFMCIYFLWYSRKYRSQNLINIGTGIFIGGAISNALDRLSYGFVRDILNIPGIDFMNKFVFNLADIFIFTGLVILIF